MSQSSGSRLVMTLLVRNEADIIESNIRFHLALGVDHVVVTDNDSSDGTREILEEFERSGVLTLIDEASPDYLQEVWVSRMATLARDRLAADWVISNDADEFWRPREGTLKTLVSSSNADAIECNRKNLLTAFEELDEQPWHDGLRFRTSTSPTKPELEDIYRDPMPQPFFYFDLSLKVIARTRGLRRIERGAHQAVFDRPARLAKGALDIYHFPIRSASAFERKIVRIGEAVRRTPGLAENISWKYRRWLSFLEHDGNAQRALADALPDARKLAHDRATGLIVEDSTLRRDLSAMGIAPSDFET